MRLRFVGVLLCFLVLAFVHHCLWVVGVGAFWVGHKCLWRADTLSGSRSTLCWRPPLLWWLPAWPASSVVLLVWVVCGGLFVICIVVASIFVLYCFFVFCLVLLGIRWMPWHQELMKDVAACDMPRGVGERALLSEGVRMGEPNLGCAGLPSSERV